HQAVVRPHREVEVVDRQRQIGGQRLVRGRGADLDALRLLVQLAGQAEQRDQGLAGRGHRVARGGGGLGLDVDDELVEVGALLDTGRLDLVGQLQHGRVDRIDRDAADLAVDALVLRRGDVAAAALDDQLDLQAALLVEGRDVQVRVVDLHAGRRGDVGGGDAAGLLAAQVHHDGLVVLRGDDQVLDVEDDLGDVLLDAGDGAELVQHAVDADRGDRGAGDGGQQRAAQGVSEGVAETRLERLDDEPGAVL